VIYLYILNDQLPLPKWKAETLTRFLTASAVGPEKLGSQTPPIPLADVLAEPILRRRKTGVDVI
jgi:hypothetical protein